MSRLVKGGVWKNSEDEILKVAVMKYGKNQWARISSLLVRKTPKQCKARWYEWLDPSIKKTEWSKEEEEKLLHLAKIMPTQWRTIAPIVGRTASQCLEHYEKLLDTAQSKAEEASASVSFEDARRLRPGEVDPSPETKPARPDPVDMDEDEKEMLSEARARLANTQGKKAKRKAREKQLEEARRLSTLQKRRELSAAGINAPGYKMRGMNYNIDIPFERKPPPGFFDPSGDLAREAQEKVLPKEQRIPIVRERRRVDVEAEARQKDLKKAKFDKEAGALDFSAMKRLTEEKFGNIRRGKLILPAPTLNENEFDQFVKLGLSNEEARAIILENGTPASSTLVPNYAPTPLRTPLVRVDGENKSVRSSFTSSTPMSIISSTPGRSEALSAEEMKLRKAVIKKRLEVAFAGLPLPKNDFEIVVPELTLDHDEISDRGKGEEDADFNPDLNIDDATRLMSIEDAAETDARLADIKSKQEISKSKRRPSAIQRNLPLPNFQDVDIIDECVGEMDDYKKVRLLIQNELKEIISTEEYTDDIFSPYSDDEISRGQALLQRELEVLKEGYRQKLHSLKETHDKIYSQLFTVESTGDQLLIEKLSELYAVSTKDPSSMINLTNEERLLVLKNEFNVIKEQLISYTSRSKQLENKIISKITPFLERAKHIRLSITDLGEQMSIAKVDLFTLKNNSFFS